MSFTDSFRSARCVACATALVVGVLILLGAEAGTVRAVTSAPAWSAVPLPWGSSWTAYDVCAYGATSLVLAGDDGHIAVSRNAGQTWKVTVPSGFASTAFTGVSLSGNGRGAVASGGRLLVTKDGGSTWAPPSYSGPGAGAAINDIAQRGSQFVAVGDDGVIMTSEDGGSTWRRSDSPTSSSLLCVAIAGDGTAVAGSDAGEILVGDAADGWMVAGVALGAVTSVAASTSPAWNDGIPDLVAAAGSDVRGSDDRRTFATLPGLPSADSQPWSRMAWPGVPGGALLVAGDDRAGFLETTTQGWVAGGSGLSHAAQAAAPTGQSVAYLLGADGSLVRTVSAGREPVTVSLSSARILVGKSTTLRATLHVGAPGRVVLSKRAPGSSWVTMRTVAWSAAEWNKKLSFKLSPNLNQEYTLSFNYGGIVVPLMPLAKVTVVPKVLTERSQYKLRVGDVFRFSGSVSPQLSGERVELYTDRGGKWRPVAGQRSVGLQKGRTWSSRWFGATRRETYHLRAHLPSTRRHAEVWSRIVTVSIR